MMQQNPRPRERRADLITVLIFVTGVTQLIVDLLR